MLNLSKLFNFSLEVPDAADVFNVSKSIKHEQSILKDYEHIKHLSIIKNEYPKILKETIEHINIKSRRGLTSCKIVIRHYHKLATIIPSLQVYKNIYVFRSDCEDIELHKKLYDFIIDKLSVKGYYLKFNTSGYPNYLYISWDNQKF